jgi:hypothetical protein
MLYLKAAHVPRVSGILQTVLIAFQEELEEKSAIGIEKYKNRIVNH